VDCLSEDVLQVLVRGDLSPLEVRAVEEHLDTCPSCREVLATVMRASLHVQPERSGASIREATYSAQSLAEASAFVRGSTVGRYVVLEPLGSGGMGVVLLARDPELDRQVALKLIRPAADAAHGDALHKRLRREARAMARLTHPNVVAVYDVGQIGDLIFVAMEYVPGGNVRQWLHAAPRSWREVVDVFIRAGRGLAAAHAAGLVHRDFKPDNILVADDGSVRVADFGLARIEDLPSEAPPGAAAPGAASHFTATTTGLFMGTPAYMAPEVLANGRADARSDLFSFCVSLYEALYGERPFSPEARISSGEIRNPPRGSAVPAWVRRLLLRGMRRRPEERPSSMDALLARLARDPARRRKWISAVTALVVVMLFTALRTLWHGSPLARPAQVSVANREGSRPGGAKTTSDESVTGEDGAPAASRLYDDFSSGEMSGTRWAHGEYQAVVRDRSAALSHAIREVQAFRTHTTNLIVRPPANGEVTTLQTDVVVDSATAGGDTSSAAGIDLWFQPRANRLSFPFNTNRLMIVRVYLELQAHGPLVARYVVLLCRDDFEDCSQGVFIGPARPPHTSIPKGEEFASTWKSAAGSAAAGTWKEVVPVSLGEKYTISVSVNPTSKVVSFAVSDRAGKKLATSVDLSRITTPFTPDLSPGNFSMARLLARLSGGNIGHGDGSVSARFDNVKVGIDGGAASPFDDFSTGTTFDSNRWNVGGESARIEGSKLRMTLDQQDVPGVAGMDMADASASALQADVTVESHSSKGTGRIAAQLREVLYNDGSAGSGTAPDDNEPNSETGDVAASINMSDEEVFYVVERCNTSQCSRTGSGFSYVQPPTSLGKVAPGTKHTLYMNWDAARHRLLFRLDKGPIAFFDPLAAGYPMMSGPRIRSKRIAVVATSSSPSDPFSLGSSGSLAATFANVRTN